MCKIAIRNAGMKQDDIARVLNVSPSFLSRSLGKTKREWQYYEKETVYIDS